MIVKIRKQLGPRLQSEPKGRKDFATLCHLLSSSPTGTLVILDFDGVETVTASWISAAILPLLRMSANERTELYFLIANSLEAEWLDDLRLVGRFNNQSFFVTGDNIRKATVIGPLDDGLRRALGLVQQMNSATGAKLAEKCPEEKIQPTAWNNRLRELYDQRLVRRVKRGREQVYSPVVEVISFDG